MDLQTNGGKPVTSDNAYPPTNFRAYSQQTADVNRSQPDTIQAARPFPSRRTLYVGSTDGMRGCAH